MSTCMAFCEMSGGYRQEPCNRCERVVDGYCPKREDKTHCEHWWDGQPCCSCGTDEPKDVEKGVEGSPNAG